MHFLRSASFLLVVFFLVPANADSIISRFQPGQRYESGIELARFSIPLPKGEWTLVYANEYFNNNRNTIIDVGLVVHDSRKINQLLIISTNVDLSNNGWYESKECERKDIIYINKSNNYQREQECSGISHYIWKDTSDTSPMIGGNFQKFSKQSGLRFPHTSLYQFIRLARQSTFISMYHHINTETLGFNDPKTSWSDSPWRKGRIEDDAKRMSIVSTMTYDLDEWLRQTKKAGYFR